MKNLIKNVSERGKSSRHKRQQRGSQKNSRFWEKKIFAFFFHSPQTQQTVEWSEQVPKLLIVEYLLPFSLCRCQSRRHRKRSLSVYWVSPHNLYCWLKWERRMTEKIKFSHFSPLRFPRVQLHQSFKFRAYAPRRAAALQWNYSCSSLCSPHSQFAGMKEQ